MNIKIYDRLYIDKISVIKGSSYDGLVRYNKAVFKNDVNILKLSVYTISHSCWEKSATLIFNAIMETLPPEGNDIYCFMTNPSWQENTRIAKYYGLGHYLVKKFEITPLDFLFEKLVSNGHKVIFYGVVKLISENAKDIFKILSDHQNGILFSSLGITDINFNLLIEELTTLVAEKSRHSHVHLNIIKAINLILSKDNKAFLPYAWEETGSYHLDIFERC